jgi:hypothetical protein
MFCPVALVPVRGVIVACCLGCVLLFVVCGVVKLLSSLPSFPLNFKQTKKKLASPMAVTLGTLQIELVSYQKPNQEMHFLFLSCLDAMLVHY